MGLDSAGASSPSGMNLRAAAFMQYLLPVGRGPSSKTCPRCEPARASNTSTLGMNGTLESLTCKDKDAVDAELALTHSCEKGGYTAVRREVTCPITSATMVCKAESRICWASNERKLQQHTHTCLHCAKKELWELVSLHTCCSVLLLQLAFSQPKQCMSLLQCSACIGE